MTTLMADVRYAWRSLRQAPVFTTVAVLSIALGIGANAAIFTLVDQVLLRLLPVKDPARLVMLKGPNREHYGSNYGAHMLSYPMYEDFRDQNEVFDGMFCRYAFPVQIGGISGASSASGASGAGGGTERANGEMVSGSYFPVLGVRPALGRLFGPDDDRAPGAAPYAVLSHGYWTSRFNRDPNLLGKGLIINNQPLTIVGVAEEGFTGVDVGETVQVFIPVVMSAQMAPSYLVRNVNNRRARWVHVFGRLEPGITAEQAEQRLQPFYRSVIAEEVKETAFARASDYSKSQFLRSRITLLPGAQGWSYARDRLTKPLWVLMALVGGVLLIACANVANLQVARAAARQREIAIRLALGAGRLHIIQQLLVESLVIAFAGGAIGLLIATASIGPLLSLLVSAEHRMNVSTAIDLRIAGAAFAATVVTGVLFGLVPALQATRPRLASTLKDEAGSVAGGGAVRLRKALVVVQVSLSLLLLIGAGLFVRSINHLMTVDLGFRTSQLVSFALDPRINGYDEARSRELFRALRARLEAMPGVERVAQAAITLLGNGGWDQWMTVEGYKPADTETIDPYCNAVSPGYFATIGVPLIAGRDFEERDILPIGRRGEGDVAIVSESFAKRYFKDGRAIGRRLGMGKDPGTPLTTEIIGVVKDARFNNVGDEPPLLVFFPSVSHGNVLVETRLTGAAIFPGIRAAVRELDPNLPVYNMKTIDAAIKQSTRNERLMASLSAVFGLLATLLAAIGLYGVLAYTVTRRTREIGIRMALGALRSHVSWLVLREVLLLVAAGIAIALPVAWWLGRYVKSQLHGVAPMDPAALMLSLGGLSLVALLAGLIPTMRALRINPVRALRQG
jgi:predicted permease